MLDILNVTLMVHCLRRIGLVYGVAACIRNQSGNFVTAMPSWFYSDPPPNEAEAMTLLAAVKYAENLNMQTIYHLSLTARW